MRCFKLLLAGGILLALSVPASAITLVYEEGPKTGQAFERVPQSQRRFDRFDPLYADQYRLTFKLTDYTDSTVYADGTTGGYSGLPDAAGYASGVSDLDGLKVFGPRNTSPGYGPYGTEGEDTWGIAKVTRIQDQAGYAVWTPAGKGEELTAIFYGSQDFYIEPSGERSRVNAVGMKIDMYEDVGPTTAFDPTGGPDARTGQASYPTLTDGTLVLSMDALPGFLNPTGTGGGLATEFETLFDFDTNLGDGELYAEVRGDGVEDDLWDNNAFNALADAYANGFPDTHLADFQIVFDSEPTSIGDDPATPEDESWLVISDDPMKTYPLVPEPVTMAGLILGIGGLAGYVRRRRR